MNLWYWRTKSSINRALCRARSTGMGVEGELPGSSCNERDICSVAPLSYQLLGEGGPVSVSSIPLLSGTSFAGSIA